MGRDPVGELEDRLHLADAAVALAPFSLVEGGFGRLFLWAHTCTLVNSMAYYIER